MRSVSFESVALNAFDMSCTLSVGCAVSGVPCSGREPALSATGGDECKAGGSVLADRLALPLSDAGGVEVDSGGDNGTVAGVGLVGACREGRAIVGAERLDHLRGPGEELHCR